MSERRSPVRRGPGVEKDPNRERPVRREPGRPNIPGGNIHPGIIEDKRRRRDEQDRRPSIPVPPPEPPRGPYSPENEPPVPPSDRGITQIDYRV